MEEPTPDWPLAARAKLDDAIGFAASARRMLDELASSSRSLTPEERAELDAQFERLRDALDTIDARLFRKLMPRLPL